MAQINVDMQNFLRCKQQMKVLADQKKEIKSNHDQLEAQAIPAMMQTNTRWIDPSGSRQPPFIKLCKHVKQGSMNSQRKLDFYNRLLSEINQGRKFTAAQVLEQEKKFQDTFAERSLKINLVTNVPTEEGVQDLQQWLDGQG